MSSHNLPERFFLIIFESTFIADNLYDDSSFLRTVFSILVFILFEIFSPAALNHDEYNTLTIAELYNLIGAGRRIEMSSVSCKRNYLVC